MFQSIELFSTQEQLVEGMNDTATYLLLIGEGTVFDHEALPKEGNYCGGIFPYVIFEGNYYINGIVAAKLNDDVRVNFVPHMHEAQLDAMFSDDTHSLFVVVDGLSSYIVEFLEMLFEVAPVKAKMLGGGAGKLTLQQEPVLFDSHRLMQDAALILSTSLPLSVGVNHGWQKLHGPLIATDTEKNILKQLNYDEAFKVYKEIVEADSGLLLSPENFFDIAKSYPLGVTKYGYEVIVRDPIMTNGKELTLVGEMDINSVVTVLKGRNELLIEAAGKAAQSAKEHLKHVASSCLVVDCISRVLFLEDDFEQELDNIKNTIGASLQQWGMLTLGEIANVNEGNIEFYNKTCVIGIL